VIRNPKILYGIQILRAVAALCVVFRHAGKEAIAADAFPIGQFGVDIFFVISGIVIYRTGRNLDWHLFFRRRLARVVPMYWLVLLLHLVVSLATHDGTLRGTTGITNAVAAFFFIPAFDVDGNIFPPVVPGWSLNYEFYFYVACTFILALVPRRHFLPAVCAVIAGMIVVMLPWTSAPARSLGFAPLVLFLPLSLEFVAGIILAHLYERGLRTGMPINAVLLAAATVWLFVAPASDPYDFRRIFLWGPPAVALTWAVLACEEALPFYRFRPGLVLGDASYALYIWHPVVLAVFFRLIAHFHMTLSVWLTIPVVVLASVVASVVIHLLIELRTVRAASRLLGIGSKPEAQIGMSSDALRPL